MVGGSLTPTLVPSYVAAPSTVFVALRDELAWPPGARSRLDMIVGDPPYPRLVPIHRAVAALIAKLNRDFGTGYSAATLNRYVDGSAGLGWHADDREDEADLGHPSAILSFGAPRPIEVRPEREREPVQSYLLTDGSLFIMPAGFQSVFWHRIPLVEHVGERISIMLEKSLLAT